MVVLGPLKLVYWSILVGEKDQFVHNSNSKLIPVYHFADVI